MVKIFRKLQKFMSMAHEGDFQNVWGPKMGSHFWKKWSVRYDLNSLLANMDDNFLEQLESHLEGL
jgi:hypothetical protein